MLTHHEIVDRIVKQIVLVITEMCKESKLCQKFMQTVKFLVYLFIWIHLLLYCRYMGLKKGTLSKKMNHLQPLKLQQNKNFSQINMTERL